MDIVLIVILIAVIQIIAHIFTFFIYYILIKEVTKKILRVDRLEKKLGEMHQLQITIIKKLQDKD
jgi:hypothetical protein